MLKSFDFFRKIQTEQQLTSTTGGFFTILAFVTAGILIFLSIQDYYHETYITFLAVKQDESEYLPMRIDITFDQFPCNVMQIQFHDELEYHEDNLQEKLKMYMVKQNNQETLYEKNTDRAKEKLSIEQAIKAKQQCRINGIINLPKTPGTLTFKPTAHDDLIQEIEKSLTNPLRLSYKLKVLQFGLGNNTFDFPIAHKSPIVEQYIKDLEGNIASRDFVQDFLGFQNKVNFYNHMKIIPVAFDQKSSFIQTGEKYRYSLRAGTAPCQQPFQSITFNSQIQPINIVYKKQEASLYKLAVNILAIVGGTVATIGIVNSISHFLFNIKK